MTATIISEVKMRGTNAQRLAYGVAGVPDNQKIYWEETDTGNSYELIGASWSQTSTNGAALVSTAGAPGELVAPTIYTNGSSVSTVGTKVVINSGASAGSQHLQAAADTEADVLQELVGFEFLAADGIKKALLGILIDDSAASEAFRASVTLNGDVVSDSTILFNETSDQFSSPRGVIAEINVPSGITRIGVMPKASGLTKTTGAICELYCVGVKA